MDELLQLLCRNAMESSADLARMLDMDEEEVRHRIRDYEKNGIIRGYQAIVNENALETNTVTAVVEIKVTPVREGGFDHTAERVSRFPEVESLYLMSGTYDLLAMVRGRDLREIATFVSAKLAMIEGVLSTATHFMLKAYKKQGVLMEEPLSDERLQVSP